MDNTITILGLVSGITGIIGFFFPSEWKEKIIIKIVFTLIILTLTSYIVFLNSKVDRIEKVSKSANLLIEKKQTEFTSEGFILAALSFLEQNKKDFPDSYERAKKIFEKYDNDKYRAIESVNISNEIEGLIKGIGILSTVENK
ncbi:hypothetical protein SAMN05421780_108128 [Flexibacter flexilis DSM 6793]|uniref:Uncharacterized protein n=1 Tax=Flexibacter flexilis DSM 6793 TaxID=927664 RepID=A0A1I1LJR1_9BACT|nr:hypothetical protein [Flexibacter flexilis]SFC69720.1 hypothetical protein SAMN05421780_108128 [Flexibacter flexilis DSM 6793]